MNSFDHKVIVVTGASAGLGKAICLALSNYTCTIAGLARNKEALELVKDEIEASKKAVFLPILCDVSKETDCYNAIQLVLQQFHKIDILINNAGFSNIRLFSGEAHIQIIKEVMQTNFFGSINCTAYAFKSIVENKGSIINISSVAGYSPLVGRTAYAASKYAMHGFFQTLSAEISSSNVHIMMVCPTFIATQIRRDNNVKVETENLSPEEVANKILKGIIKKKKLLIIGKTAIFAWWLNRFFPSLYEKIMIKNQLRKISPKTI